MSVSQEKAILARFQKNPNSIYAHLRINPKFQRSGVRVIIWAPITAPLTAPSLNIRMGCYAEGHYDEVESVQKGERERVSQKARTLSLASDTSLDVEAALCHELMHDIFYAIFGSSQRSQFYNVVRESLKTHYLKMRKEDFWRRSQNIPPEKEFLTDFFHVIDPSNNPLSNDLVNRSAFAAELFAHLGMEFLGYPAEIVFKSWLNGKLPPQLIDYFKNLNLSTLDDQNWQEVVILRSSLKDGRDRQEGEQLKHRMKTMYNRAILADSI